MKTNYGVHRCGARASWRKAPKRYKGIQHHRSFKHRTLKQVYDMCKQHIKETKDIYTWAEVLANKFEVKVHLVTQAFALLNKEGILAQRSIGMCHEGCWTAKAYYIMKKDFI